MRRGAPSGHGSIVAFLEEEDGQGGREGRAVLAVLTPKSGVAETVGPA